MKWPHFGPKLLFTQRYAVFAAQHLRIGPIMYETHFGLTKRPFRALAAGGDVFVGPQTAATMAGFKKALTTPDAIVTVSGPPGVGKTTLVRRALDAISNHHVVVSVGRIPLGHDEVLELLLEELGAEMPSGTVQRFTRFRRLLGEHADKGIPVFVIVEDVKRVGVDALAELEALTASDAGVSEGANVVLMGDEDINELLKSPLLARLKTRLRLRHKILPLSSGELTAYLKHGFRVAGIEFDEIFEPGTADVLHCLTGGIPRMANNLVESVLTSAAETKQDRIGVALIKLIATEEYGLEATQDAPVEDASAVEAPAEAAPEMPDVVEAAAESAPEMPSVIEARVVAEREEAPVTEARVEAEPEVAPVVETPVEVTHAAQPDTDSPIEVPSEVPVLTIGLPPRTHADVEPFEEHPAAKDENTEDSIPQLIYDTLPDLAILAPALARSTEPGQPPEPDLRESPAGVEKSDDQIPILSSIATDERNPEIVAALEAAQVGPVESDVPEWERDPTLAELRPDLDALEHAMSLAQGLAPETNSDPGAAPGADLGEADEPVPAITLDREIQAKIDEATDILKKAELAAEEQEESEEDDVVKPDNKSTAEILAEAKDKPTADMQRQAPSLEAQFEAAEVPIAPPAAKIATAPTAPASESTAASVVDDQKTPPPMPSPELRDIAANISKAKTINDVDDQMAETLFGEDFSVIAAQLSADPSPASSANDEIDLSLEESGHLPTPDIQSAAAVEIDPEPQPKAPTGNIDLAATQQRLATVRALNAGSPAAQSSHEAVVLAEEPVASTPAADNHPESIEEQINTSITQTLKALNVRPPQSVADDEDGGDERKSSFFSRFRRT
jgi:general secretion pathway protein A